MAHYDIFRHQLLITAPAYGYALWDPDPGNLYPAVEVGDVGYIREGKFHRLFNVLLPAGHPSHGNGVPEYHEQLDIKNHINKGTLSPHNFCSTSVTLPESDLQANGPKQDGEVSFLCRMNQGAVLCLPIKAKKEDTVAIKRFGKWMIKHIDTWFEWAQQLELGVDRMEDIILVTGTHRTRSYTNVAFPGGREDAQASFRANLKVDHPDGITINWQLSHENIRGAHLNPGPDGKDLPEDQCIFIRGFRVIRKYKIFPRLKGAAGPNPDPEGYDEEPDMELVSVPTIPEYRDPLHILLEFIAEEVLNCDMALVHDDDLAELHGIYDGTPIESLQPDAMLSYLRSAELKILVDQIPFGPDLLSVDNGGNTDTETVCVATLSNLFEELSPSPASPSPQSRYHVNASLPEIERSLIHVPLNEGGTQSSETSVPGQEEFEIFANQIKVGSPTSVVGDRAIERVRAKASQLGKPSMLADPWGWASRQPQDYGAVTSPISTTSYPGTSPHGRSGSDPAAERKRSEILGDIPWLDKRMPGKRGVSASKKDLESSKLNIERLLQARWEPKSSPHCQAPISTLSPPLNMSHSPRQQPHPPPGSDREQQSSRRQAVPPGWSVQWKPPSGDPSSPTPSYNWKMVKSTGNLSDKSTASLLTSTKTQPARPLPLLPLTLSPGKSTPTTNDGTSTSLTVTGDVGPFLEHEASFPVLNDPPMAQAEPSRLPRISPTNPRPIHPLTHTSSNTYTPHTPLLLDSQPSDQDGSNSEAGTLWQTTMIEDDSLADRLKSTSRGPPLTVKIDEQSNGLPMSQTKSSGSSGGGLTIIPNNLPLLDEHPPPSPPFPHRGTRTPTARQPNRRPSKSESTFQDSSWASRPNPEEVLERLEVFFPEHDLDKPEATSGGTSPITAEYPPAPLPYNVRAADKRAGHKKSIRVVAEEHNLRQDRTSRLQSSSAANVFRKRSTKLWDSRVEEVTPGQITSGMPSIPDSPSVSGSGTTAPKPIFKWVRGELIGKGNFGRVYLALNATSGEMITVKQVEIPRMASDKNDSRQVTIVEALKLEGETLKDLDHPNIVQYLGFEETPNFLSIFLEYVPGGSVGSCLRKYGRFEQNVTKYFTEQILSGLEYLHSKGILHRDLKADNILVEKTGICKISDFGISKRTDDMNEQDVLTPMQGTVFWMAPEVVNTGKRGYNAKVDIWSVGCVVLEMWAGERPWSKEEAMTVIVKLYSSKQAPPIPPGIVLSDAGDDFRRKCFAINPDERPSAADLRKHHYLHRPPGWAFSGLSDSHEISKEEEEDSDDY